VRLGAGRRVGKGDEWVEVERGAGLLIERDGGGDVKEEEDGDECAVEVW
jgi:hypothetical protein